MSDLDGTIKNLTIKKLEKEIEYIELSIEERKQYSEKLTKERTDLQIENYELKNELGKLRKMIENLSK